MGLIDSLPSWRLSLLCYSVPLNLNNLFSFIHVKIYQVFVWKDQIKIGEISPQEDSAKYFFEHAFASIFKMRDLFKQEKNIIYFYS